MVLSLFTRGFSTSYYIREVCRLLPISHGTAQSVLTHLEEKGVLSSAIKGKIRTFSLSRTDTARQYLVFTEVYKRLLLLERKPFIGEVLYKVIPFISGCAAVYGSVAKGTEHEDSDLDLFIAGTCDKEGVERISRIFGIEINLKVYPQDLFARAFGTDPLLKEVLSDHVIIHDPDYLITTVVV
jgi:hypothetical protein